METKNKDNTQKIETAMIDTNPIIQMIILYVSSLDASVKIQKLSEWIKKQNPTICYL